MHSAENKAIPTGVWALGLVSLFMDVSSEMIHGLLPVFIVSVLGASASALGLLEGIAEALVLMTKMFSGALSDWFGRRKGLALIGYGLAAFTKPLFPLANSLTVAVAARLIDRLGKGIRGAPRDALVADLTSAESRGAAFGLRQSLDTLGALLGPLAAMLFMLMSGGNFRFVFWIAVLPAFISVAVLAVFVHEPPAGARNTKAKPPIRWQELHHFSISFWWIVATGAIFTLARFSEAFLVLRAENLGLSINYLPVVLVVMNVVYSASAYPAGKLSDQIDRRYILAAGAAVLAIADLILARADGPAALFAGVALWGLHMGLSQGLLAALVVDAAPPDRRGTAFGLFSLATGVALLAASVIAGELWDRSNPATPFYAGSLFAMLALFGLWYSTRVKRSGPRDRRQA